LILKICRTAPAPFRRHLDLANDGAEEVNADAYRVRAEFLARAGLADLLSPGATR
jgi:hypothetical protein